MKGSLGWEYTELPWSQGLAAPARVSVCLQGSAAARNDVPELAQPPACSFCPARGTGRVGSLQGCRL